MPDTTTAETPALEGRLADFSSRLSPMLVKELRQGMRTNLFVIAFILLQTFMMLCLLAGLANPGSNDSTAFFWFFIIVTLLVIQPLRGFSALSSEYQLNTMDLIQLTRLNGWRITLGKWTALNAQGLLFIIGVLPYLVIRYFLSSVDLIQDITALGAVSLGSALATAITIGCSVFRSLILRGVILVGVAVLIIVTFNVFAFTVFGRYGSGFNFAYGGLLAVVGLYGIFFFLSFGASRIAPLSENHATRKRLVAIGFALLCQLFYFAGLDSEVFLYTAVILGLACIDALTEPLPIFSQVLKPFAKSPLLRPAALFLCPGWLGGLGFFVLSSLLWLGSGYLSTVITGSYLIKGMEEHTALVSGCNLIAFPLLIIHLFFPKHGSHHFTFGIYTFIQAGLFVATLMVAAIASAITKWDDIIYLLVPLPSVQIAASMDSSLDSVIHLVIALTTFFLCIAFPLLRNLRSVREFLTALKPAS